MKNTRNLLPSCLLGALLLALPAVVKAQTYTNGAGFVYTTNNGTVTITGYTGPGGALAIPNTISNLPVSTIGGEAFFKNTNLTTVTIPTNVNSIGNSAFQYASLTSVTIPNSVTNIGEYAFYYTSLTSVTIPASVTTIGSAPFASCLNLTAITVAPGNLFYSSVNGILFDINHTMLIQYPAGSTVRGYTISNSVASIGDYAFAICTFLASITIPDSVTNIGSSAFNQCYSLTNIEIPASVTSIGDSPFSLCTSLTAVTVDSNNLAYISVAGVLFDKNETTLITYPALKAGASYTIPNSVTSIEDYAFADDGTNLTSITIPNGVTSIGIYALEYNSGLIGVYFQGNAPTPTNDTSVFFGDTSATAYYYAGTTGWGATFDGIPTVELNSAIPPANALLYEDFESGVLDPRISISTVGGYNTSPGIFNESFLDGSRAFGFGLSTCAANCFDAHITYFIITFPAATSVGQLSFSSVEEYGNWGSQGLVFINQNSLPSSSDPALGGFDTELNDTPTSSNTFVFPINQPITNIMIMVHDITDVSEIFIDDVTVTGQATNPPPAVVTWANPASIAYGMPLGSNQLNATANAAGSFAYTPASGTVLDAGSNSLTVIFTPSNTVDYSSVTDSVSLAVATALLTVTANNTNRVFGQTNPVFTGTITGLTNGDNITATYSCSAATNSLPGAYPIVPSLADPNHRLVNYTTNSVNGLLTVISPPPVTNNPPSGMALIPAGSFTMGDTLDGDVDAVPVSNVYVSAFYMDTNLVSYSQWGTVYTWAATNGYGFDNPGSGRATNQPVQTVDWYDVVKWNNARSQEAGLTPVYYTDEGLTQVYKSGETDLVYANWAASGYRLPTEAEWEKGARGGSNGLRFPWGDTISESQANYYGDPGYDDYDLGPVGYNATFDTGAQPYTSPVGHFATNGYGLNDMAGNVWQWCWDWYGTPYAGGSNPHGPSSSDYGVRVARGGGWDGYAYACRTANRSDGYPNEIDDDQGFRSVMTIPTNGVAPSITTGPMSQTNVVGKPVNFSIVTAGTAPLSYQWYFDSNLLSSATASAYSIASIQASNAGSYMVTVANAFGTTNATATLTVVLPPIIITQPTNVTVLQGSPATFVVAAVGVGPLTYQWNFNNAPINAATSTSYTIASVQSTNAGTYSVIADGAGGPTSSSNAVLVVEVPTSTTNINIYNTGLDNQSNPLTPGNSDPHYVIISAPLGTQATPFAPYVVTTNTCPFNGAWLADNAVSQWDGPQSNYNCSTQDPLGDYDYRTTFDLTGLNPASATITFQIIADDLIQDVLINGTSAGLSFPTPQNFVTWLGPYAISNGFVPGTNTLDFIVVNTQGNGANPSGLRVQVSGTASTNGALSNVPTNGLIGYWPGDGTAADASPIHNNGTFAGSYAPGAPKGGEAFNLATGKVYISNNPAYNFTNYAGWSVGFWFNANGSPINADSGVFLGQDNGAESYPKWFIDYSYVLSGSYNLHVNDYNGEGIFIGSQSEPTPTGWNQLTVTIDNTDNGAVDFYLNGQAIGTASLGNYVLETTAQLIFGYAEPGLSYSGLLSDVVIYDRVLSPNEALQLALVSVATPFSITNEQLDGKGNMVITWPSSPGAYYHVVSASNLAAPISWSAVGSPVVATNTNTSATIPISSTVKFFSVTSP